MARRKQSPAVEAMIRRAWLDMKGKEITFLDWETLAWKVFKAGQTSGMKAGRHRGWLAGMKESMQAMAIAMTVQKRQLLADLVSSRVKDGR